METAKAHNATLTGEVDPAFTSQPITGVPLVPEFTRKPMPENGNGIEVSHDIRLVSHLAPPSDRPVLEARIDLDGQLQSITYRDNFGGLQFLPLDKKHLAKLQEFIGVVLEKIK